MYIKWIATVCTLVGATLTSLRIDPYNIWALNMGSTLFLIWSIRLGDRALITVNAGLLGIYLFGLVYQWI